MMLERSVRENARKSFSQNQNNTVCLYNLQTVAVSWRNMLKLYTHLKHNTWHDIKLKE